eukprot:TRINITY_DN14148_c0_g1_i1.p1 TRINITY_DN14148_c0_g1~~TRINITY_DN14148_c0_g1_i1.p1  ORF type:complete len:150 (+),score=8.29 TRINITY_DN14148_c0_g1_i1:49-498(+)
MSDSITEVVIGSIEINNAMGPYTPSLIKYGGSIMTLNALWHAVYNYFALKRTGQPVSRDQVFKPNLSNFGYLAMAVLSLLRLRRGPSTLRSTEFLILGLVNVLRIIQNGIPTRLASLIDVRVLPDLVLAILNLLAAYFVAKCKGFTLSM